MNDIQRSLYFKIVVEGMDADDATEDVMNEFDSAFGLVNDQTLIDQMFGLVRPLIHDKAKRIYRNHTRALENKVFSDKPMTLHSIDRETGEVIESEEPIEWHEAQKKLVSRTFSLPNGTYVTYEDSTPEDHEQRARWQKGRASSIIEDAGRHERLAELMRSHGAERLGDLDLDLWRSIVDGSKK
jgi:hypothetical protein